ncbi:hypothetical protein [Sphingomonas sp.]|uniref:hypothetical protein n=1 Tax=Sphingomonas sp. TaxID=28214 RepID=UPI002D7E7FC3|nr:hypothetical protein [Sphingomonas sp.]
MLVAAIGALLLRFGWDAREPAQTRLTLAGWAAIAAALLALTLRDGAWGLAIGTLPVMLVAGCVLMREAWASAAPARPARAADSDPTVRLHAADWRDVGRRLAIFLLVVPVSGLASLVVGLAAAAMVRAAGGLEGDATVLTLFVTPLVWSVLGVALMLGMRARDMLRPLGAVALVSGAVFWSLG